MPESTFRWPWLIPTLKNFGTFVVKVKHHNAKIISVVPIIASLCGNQSAMRISSSRLASFGESFLTGSSSIGTGKLRCFQSSI
jgi:hypothetical protein